MDSKMQKLGKKIFPWMELPHICGFDVAGEVWDIEPKVTRFQIGNRVCGLAIGVPPKPPHKATLSSGFQEYTLLDEALVAPIPKCMTFETMAVIPTGLSTAASGLYQKEYF